MPDSRKSIALYIVYALVAGLLLDRALTSMQETRRLRRDAATLAAEIARLRQQNDYNQRVYSALTTDPFYVERQLRERFGYRAPDEELPTQPRDAAAPQPQAHAGSSTAATQSHARAGQSAAGTRPQARSSRPAPAATASRPRTRTSSTLRGVTGATGPRTGATTRATRRHR